MPAPDPTWLNDLSSVGAIAIPLLVLALTALLGRRVRDLFGEGPKAEARVRAKVDDDYVREFAFTLVGELGGKVGVAPRTFLRKLVTNVLDKVELFDTFDPRRHAGVDLAPSELTREEAAAMAHESVEDVALDLPDRLDLDQ